jgi:hypothetical protein
LARVLQAWVFDRTAVIVFPWREPAEPPERGARVEVRLLAEEPNRGSFSAAQRVVIDHPVFRADLFDQTTAEPGNLRSAHFHPHFEGVEPCDRNWLEVIKRDPAGWLASELGDLAGMLNRSGVDTGDGSWIAHDAAELREAIPAIVSAVEATWSMVRAEAV